MLRLLTQRAIIVGAVALLPSTLAFGDNPTKDPFRERGLTLKGAERICIHLDARDDRLAFSDIDPGEIRKLDPKLMEQLAAARSKGDIGITGDEFVAQLKAKVNSVIAKKTPWPRPRGNRARFDCGTTAKLDRDAVVTATIVVTPVLLCRNVRNIGEICGFRTTSYYTRCYRDACATRDPSVQFVRVLVNNVRSDIGQTLESLINGAVRQLVR